MRESRLQDEVISLLSPDDNLGGSRGAVWHTVPPSGGRGDRHREIWLLVQITTDKMLLFFPCQLNKPAKGQQRLS